MSPQRRSQLGRRLRSGALLGGQEEEWSSAATFDFVESPSAKRQDKLDKMNNNSKKLRRQTMMPRKTAAAPATTIAFASPPLSQRRTRRQSMMPVKLPSPKVTSKGKTVKTQPPSPDPADTAKAKTKRKLDPVEASPKNKKPRLIPISKSSSQVKAAPSPASSKKHKSLSLLPISRSSRKSASDKSGKTQQTDKAASPAKKRTLSPSHPKASSPKRKKAPQPSPVKESPPPKKRAASRSRSESSFVRRKSLPRGQKKAAKVPDKLATPSPKKAVTPQKKASSSVRLPPSSPAKSPASRLKSKTPTAKKTSSTALKTPPKTTPKSKSTTSLRSATSPVSKTPKTPKANLKKKATSPIKTPPSSKKNTSKKTPTVLSVKKGLTPSKTPLKTPPPSQKKTPKKTTNAGSKKTPSVPAKTPPSALKKVDNKTPMVVLKKVKSPVVKMPSSLKKSSLKATTPSTPSPRKNRLTRSAAKSQMLSTSKSVKHVSLKMDGKSPPSSIASFRKTPSSKKIVAVLAPEDLGASPELPSARTQLQRIRVSIASAQKNRNTQPTPRKALVHTPAVTATPSLDRVVTKADIHVSGNGKCGSEAMLDNHCDPWPGSTPTARAPLPVTPKSSKASGGNVSRFRSRISSSTVETHHVQHHTTAAALPQSSTPIKGSRMLDIPSLRPSIKEDASSLSESMEGDSVDGERADTSGEESVNVDGGETSIDENEEEEEEEAEAESTTQNRKSFCSLM